MAPVPFRGRFDDREAESGARAAVAAPEASERELGLVGAQTCSFVRNREQRETVLRPRLDGDPAAAVVARVLDQIGERPLERVAVTTHACRRRADFDVSSFETARKLIEADDLVRRRSCLLS